MKTIKELVPLCFRCEHRAQYHERKIAPRCECGSSGAVAGCYMYRPVTPLVLEPREGEKRSLLLPFAVSGRAVSYGTMKGKLEVQKNSKKIIFYWVPEKKK